MDPNRPLAGAGPNPGGPKPGGPKPGGRPSDPPHRLVVSWRSLWDEETALEEPSRVTWEIDEREGFCLLTVIHDRLDGAPITAQHVSGEGWMMVLSGMKTLVETGLPLNQSV